MYYFCCDYHEGCDPAILQALTDTNLVQTPGYGEDRYCEAARAAIVRELGDFHGEIHFVVGGTQANVIVLTAGLAPYQGVLCAPTGHINVHETGAIEAMGHKCLLVEGDAVGRVCPQSVRKALEAHFKDGGNEHMVMPGMLYVSQCTELGGVYTKAQLQELKEICEPYGVGIFVDGARLGYALASSEADMTLGDLVSLCDAFTIGGTKQGLLFGEAIVLNRPELFPHFRYHIKRCGGMLAKGRLLGVQFETAFISGVYFSNAKKAVEQALRIRRALEQAGFTHDVDSLTNQQFFALPRAAYERLSQKFVFEISDFGEDRDTVHVRICTSWATKEEAVSALIAEIGRE